MDGYVTSVDWDWFTTIRSIDGQDEVNLWRPGIRHHFRALDPGEPVFFRLKSPRDSIGGFGFFSHFSILPASFAWRVFESGNGTSSLQALREELLHQRTQIGMNALEDEGDPDLGCILLRNCVLLDEGDWINPPSDLDDRAGHGKRYDLSEGEGARLWKDACERAARAAIPSMDRGRLLSSARFGARSFRVAIFDAWDRRCAMTGEGVATALEAARFAPEIPGSFSLSNGVLLRADLAYLLEAGYITITPDHIVLVSRSARSPETGRYYERYHGTGIRLPQDPAIRPDPELLWLHQTERFLDQA